MNLHGYVEEIVTNRFVSYWAALLKLGLTEDQKMGRWLNNRVKN